MDRSSALAAISLSVIPSPLASFWANYTSKNFDTPATGWKFNYDYTCKWDSGSGGISIGVGDARNPSADPDPIVFEESVKKKSGTSDALNGGSWFFKVDTFGNTCSWHVSVPKS